MRGDRINESGLSGEWNVNVPACLTPLEQTLHRVITIMRDNNAATQSMTPRDDPKIPDLAYEWALIARQQAVRDGGRWRQFAESLR